MNSNLFVFLLYSILSKIKKLKSYKLKIKWNHWMTVQVDSQSVTDLCMWYIDMCYINNSISCLEKKTIFRNTWSDMLCANNPPIFWNDFATSTTWSYLFCSNYLQNGCYYEKIQPTLVIKICHMIQIGVCCYQTLIFSCLLVLSIICVSTHRPVS